MKSWVIIIWVLGAGLLLKGAGLKNGVPAYDVFESELIGANWPVRDLSLDPLGRLVALSGQSILVYDGSDWTTFRQRSSDDGAPDAALFRVITGPDGAFYGSTERGLHRVRFVGNRRYELEPLHLEAEAPAVALDPDLREAFVMGDSLYFYGSEQIVRYNTRTKILEADVISHHTKSRFAPFGDVIVEYWSGNYIYFNYPDGRQVAVSTNRSHLARPETRQLAVWNDTLVLGHDDGLSRYENGVITRWDTELDSLPTRNILSLIPLSETKLAVGVRSQGIYIIDAEGRIVQSIDRRIDHRFGNATEFLVSGDNVVWTVFNKSIAKVNFLQPLSNYSLLLDYATQFPEAFLHHGELHLVTDGKLLCVSQFEGGGLQGFTNLLPDHGRGVQSAESTPQGILFSDFEGVYLRSNDGSVARVSDQPMVDVLVSMGGQDDSVLAAGREAYQLLRFEDGKWQVSGERIPVGHRSYFGVHDRYGNAWLENGISRVTRAFLENGQLQVEVFGPETGFSNAWVNAWTYDGRALFSSGATSRLLEWNPAQAAFAPADDALFSPLAQIPEVARPGADTDGNLFVPTAASLHSVIRVNEDGKVIRDSDALSDLRNEALVSVLPDEGGSMWILGDTKVFRYEPELVQQPEGLRAPTVFQIETVRDGTVVYQSFDGQPEEELTFPFAENSFEIDVTNSRISDRRTVSYQYRIPGRVERWTNFQIPGRLVLSNQAAGRFSVVIRPTIDETEFGPATVIAVRILKPWYQTYWAIAGFALLALGSVWLVAWLLRQGVERRNRVLQQLVHERTQRLGKANQELKVLYEKAKEADEAKSSFLASVSHEMRTPLNAIIGPAQLLEQMKGGGSDPAMKLIEMIKTAGAQLLGLVDDVLEFTSSGNGSVAMSQATFDLHDLVKESCDATRLAASEKQIEVTQTLDAPLPRNWVGDRRLVQQVLDNLLNNALKFTPNGGRIGVAVEALKKSLDASICGLKITVSDTGIGVPEAARSLIFEPFQQVETSLTRSYDGMGLGLSICRKLVARMGGEIDLSSEPGKGSSFWFCLPILPESGGEDDAEREAASDEARPEFLVGRRVLVVDDNESNRFFAKKVLSARGIKIDIANDGADAVRKAGENVYDLILMDIRMPVLNGLDASREIRRTDNLNRATPIIALSAFLSDAIEAECRNIGIDRCLNKPISCESLNEVVSRMIPQAS